MKNLAVFVGLVGAVAAAGQDFSIDKIKETFSPNMNLQDYTPNIEFDLKPPSMDL